MKKLLVLMLVVGMASLASATYTFSGGEGTATPDAGAIVGDGAFNAYFISIDGDPVDVALLYDGSLAAITDYTAEFGDFLPDAEMVLFAEFADAVDPENNIPVGDVISLLLGEGGARSLVTLHDNTSLEALGSVVLTPEPMSLALLGLGGLFLRRRK